MVPFSCSNCLELMTAKDSEVGQQKRCLACRRWTVVPAQTAEERHEAYLRRLDWHMERIRVRLLWILIALIVVALGGLWRVVPL